MDRTPPLKLATFFVLVLAGSPRGPNPTDQRQSSPPVIASDRRSPASGPLPVLGRA